VNFPTKTEIVRFPARPVPRVVRTINIFIDDRCELALPGVGVYVAYRTVLGGCVTTTERRGYEVRTSPNAYARQYENRLELPFVTDHT